MARSLLAGLALIGAAQAASVVIPAAADTSMFEGNPDFNLGGTSLVSGTNQAFSRSRAMFRFDLGDIPANAVVTGVQVLLHVTRRPDPDQHGGPTDSDFSLHRLFVSWGEGTGSGATGSVAMAGDATWNERHAGALAWGNPGGQPGEDFATDPSATTFVGDVGPYTWGSTPELVGDVSAWLQNPSSNFGFMLISQSENTLGTGRRFGSTEQSDGMNEVPRLMVTYQIPEPSSAGLLVVGLTGLMFFRNRRSNHR